MASVLQHKHLIFRIETPTPPTDVEFISHWMKELVEKIGMHLLSGPHVEYLDVVGNRGATAVCILAESHAAAHFWDEPNPGLIEFDVYSCHALDIDVVIKHIQVFNPSKIEYKFLDRENNLTLLDEGVVDVATGRIVRSWKTRLLNFLNKLL